MGDIEPVWSPDGRWIAFLSRRSGYFDLYVMHPDGTGVKRFTETKGAEFGPIWEP